PLLRDAQINEAAAPGRFSNLKATVRDEDGTEACTFNIRASKSANDSPGERAALRRGSQKIDAPFSSHPVIMATQSLQGEPMLDRRAFLAVCSRLGLTTTLLPGVLWAMADEKGKVTRAMIDSAAFIADVPIADEYKDMMLDSLNDYSKSF